MGGEVGRADKRLAALGTAIFNVDDARAAVLGQLEGIIIELMTQTTNVVADFVVNLTKFFKRFRRHLSHD